MNHDGSPEERTERQPNVRDGDDIRRTIVRTVATIGGDSKRKTRRSKRGIAVRPDDIVPTKGVVITDDIIK